MGHGEPGGPPSPGGLRADGEDRINGPVGEPRSGQRPWVVGGTSGWPCLQARQWGFLLQKQVSLQGQGIGD